MFNPLSSAFLCQSLADVLRTAASAPEQQAEETDEFERAQLLAASSIARLVALEIEHGPSVGSWLREQLMQTLAAADIGRLDAETRRSVARLEEAMATHWGPASEEAVVEVFERLVSSDEPPATELLRRLRHLVRMAIDREVQMFAHGTPPR